MIWSKWSSIHATKSVYPVFLLISLKGNLVSLICQLSYLWYYHWIAVIYGRHTPHIVDLPLDTKYTTTLKALTIPSQPIHSFWRTFRGADFRGTGRLSLMLVGIWHIICAHYRKDDCRRRQPIKFPSQCVVICPMWLSISSLSAIKRKFAKLSG